MSIAGALQVRVREVSRVVRAVDITDGQLSIDLISKVEGEDGLRASISDLPLEYELRPQKWNPHAMPPIPSNLPREYEIPSPDTSVTSAKV